MPALLMLMPTPQKTRLYSSTYVIRYTSSSALELSFCFTFFLPYSYEELSLRARVKQTQTRTLLGG